MRLPVSLPSYIPAFLPSCLSGACSYHLQRADTGESNWYGAASMLVRLNFDSSLQAPGAATINLATISLANASTLGRGYTTG